MCFQVIFLSPFHVDTEHPFQISSAPEFVLERKSAAYISPNVLKILFGVLHRRLLDDKVCFCINCTYKGVLSHYYVFSPYIKQIIHIILLSVFFFPKDKSFSSYCWELYNNGECSTERRSLPETRVSRLARHFLEYHLR